MKRRILLVAFFSVALLFPFQVKSDTDVAQDPSKPKSTKSPSTVSLTVDYGDGAQKCFPEIPWRKGVTVLDTLKWADKHPRGIEFRLRGRGELTLVTQIDDLKNSGGAASKNWIFRVNDKLGDRSCGIFLLKPEDRILWKFEQYQ